MTEAQPKRPPDPDRRNRARHANKIGSKLGEKSLRYRKQVSKIIYLCGHNFASVILAKTLEIEANGGMLINDKSRRRTPGGVFMYLAKGEMNAEQYEKFSRKKRTQKSQTEASEAVPDATSVLESQPELIESETAPASEPEPLQLETASASEPEPLQPDEPLILPEEALVKLRPLYTVAEQFQKRIDDIEASGKTAGLQSAKLMLKATQQKITAIEQQYVK